VIRDIRFPTRYIRYLSCSGLLHSDCFTLEDGVYGLLRDVGKKNTNIRCVTTQKSEDLKYEVFRSYLTSWNMRKASILPQ